MDPKFSYFSSSCWIIVLHKNTIMCDSELLAYWFMCVCMPACVVVCIHNPCLRMQAALFLCFTFLINISLFSWLILSLFSQNKVLSMLHQTPLMDWLAGWNPTGTVWVASGAREKLLLPDGCKQSFYCFFFTFICTHLVDIVQHMLTHFSTIHRGLVQHN